MERALDLPASRKFQLANRVRRQRRYSDEDRYIALAAVDLNGGNVYRTSKALGIPARTLADWVEERSERSAEFAAGRNENRGELAAKIENLLHDIIESAPGKLEKATFSQSMVGFGIGFDKLRVIRSEQSSDSAKELCELLGLTRSQLPETLELAPGEDIPAEYRALVASEVIETLEDPAGHFEPASELVENPS